jgi:hypothetical protein
MARFPDGEQVGWLPGVWQRMAQNPALEPTRKVALVGARESTDFFSQLAIQYYGVKPGYVKQGLTLGLTASPKTRSRHTGNSNK